jgi:CRP-like cAMP-binding protein
MMQERYHSRQELESDRALLCSAVLCCTVLYQSATLVAGDFLGEIALLAANTRTSDVIVAEESVCFVLTREVCTASASV